MNLQSWWKTLNRKNAGWFYLNIWVIGNPFQMKITSWVKLVKHSAIIDVYIMSCDFFHIKIKYLNIFVQRKQSNSHSMALERHLLLNSSVSIGINVYILEICLKLCYVNWMAKYVNKNMNIIFDSNWSNDQSFWRNCFLFLLCYLSLG